MATEQTSIPTETDAGAADSRDYDDAGYIALRNEVLATRRGKSAPATGGGEKAAKDEHQADDEDGAKAATESDDTANEEQAKPSGGKKAADGKERPGKEGSKHEGDDESPEWMNQRIGRFAKQARESARRAAEAEAELAELKAQNAGKGEVKAKAETKAQSDDDDPDPLDIYTRDGEVKEEWAGDDGFDKMWDEHEAWQKRQVEKARAKSSAEPAEDEPAKGEEPKAEKSGEPEIPPQVKAQFDEVEKSVGEHEDDGTFGAWFGMVVDGSLRITNPILDYLADPELPAKELHGVMNAMMENPIAANKISHLATAVKQQNALKALVKPAEKQPRKRTTENAPDVSVITGSGKNVPAGEIDWGKLADSDPEKMQAMFKRDYAKRTGKDIFRVMH